MFEKYPNPIRRFSEKRDEWFLSVLDELNIPINLFSDIRDSQIAQLSFSIEGSRIKSTRGKKKDDQEHFDLFNRSTLEAFLPRFGLSKMTREFFVENEISFEDLAEEFLEHESVKRFQGELRRTPKDWIDVIPLERMDESFVNMAEIILDNFFPLVFSKMGIDDTSVSNIRKILAEKSQLFEQFLFQTLNLDILRAIKEKSWKEGEAKDTRIITITPAEGEEVDEDDKPKSFELTYGDYRGRSNVLYSYILELISYFENPSAVPKTEKDDEGNFKQNSDPVEGTEHMSQILSLEMLLYNPTPEKSLLLPVQTHLRELGKLVESTPTEFFDVLSRNFHCLASGIVIHTKPYKPFEKLYKNIIKSFWRTLRGSDEETVERLTATIWMQFLHLDTISHQFRDAQDHFAKTFARLQHIFWQMSTTYFGNEKKFDTPFNFWSEFAKLDNLQLRNEEDAVKIFAKFTEFLDAAGFEEDGAAERLDIKEIDRHSIYKRMAFIGLQSAHAEYRDQIVEIIEKMEKSLSSMEETEEEYPSSGGFESEKRLIDSLKSSLTVFDQRSSKVEAQ